MTMKCYLLGSPEALKHSMSPAMHNAAFRDLGLDYVYEAYNGGSLEEAVGYLRSPDVKGANVTIPFKVEIMGYLDGLDGFASSVGAVNTIVNDGGVLRGFNTDGRAATRTLEESYGDLSAAKVVLVGAGGSARALAYCLADEVARLVILNRSPEKAVALAKNLANTRCKVEAGGLTYESLSEALLDAHILVNTTPLGMAPRVDETPVPQDLLRPGILVFDIVYTPLETKLLREARMVGCRTLAGDLMFVYQGAEAFRLWTGVEPPIKLMHETVLRGLGYRR
jgi:shikimate dehydrogenase